MNWNFRVFCSVAAMLCMLSFAIGFSYGLELGKSRAYSNVLSQIDKIIRERDTNVR